jgi:hypothetical protein
MILILVVCHEHSAFRWHSDRRTGGWAKFDNNAEKPVMQLMRDNTTLIPDGMRHCVSMYNRLTWGRSDFDVEGVEFVESGRVLAEFQK